MRKIGFCISDFDTEGNATLSKVRAMPMASTLTLLYGPDGDIWIGTLCMFTLRFRNGFGGTQSINMWHILRFVHFAINLDNRSVPFNKIAGKKMTPEARRVISALTNEELENFSFEDLQAKGEIPMPLTRIHDDCDGDRRQNLQLWIANDKIKIFASRTPREDLEQMPSVTVTEFELTPEEFPWTFRSLKLLGFAILADELDRPQWTEQ